MRKIMSPAYHSSNSSKIGIHNNSSIRSCLALVPEDDAAIPTARCHDATQRLLGHAVHEAHVPVLARLQELKEAVVTSTPLFIAKGHPGAR